MKTWIEAYKDGTLDTVKPKDLHNLVGFVWPEDNAWEVKLIEGGMTVKTQFEAEVLGHIVQLLELASRGPLK